MTLGIDGGRGHEKNVERIGRGGLWLIPERRGPALAR